MKHLAVVIFAVLLSTLAVADECTVDLNYNLRVSSEFLSVSNEREVVYEIHQGGVLTVKGQAVDLDEEQSALAEEFAGEVAVLVPQWITLVSDALTVAEDGLRIAFTAIFGEDSAATIKSTEALKNARIQFENSSSVEDGVYSISVSEFTHGGGAFDEEFDEAIEDAVMASMGSIFVAIGKTLLSSDEDFEDTMESFGERMEKMGRELEVMGEGLEATVDELCDGMRKVQKLERKVMRKIPELADYALFAW